jgi:hypothetical protein
MNKFFTYIFFIYFSFNHCCSQTKIDSIKNEFKTSIITNDISLQKKLSNDILKQYSTYTVLYYRNLLSNTTNNSIIITNGIEDTYPIIALQHSKKINVNARVISLNLLSHQQYIKQINKQLAIDLSDNKKIAIEQLLNQANNKVYISSTVNPKYYQSKANNLFLTGLVLELNCNNQLTLLNQFWQNFKAKKIISLNLNTFEKKIFQNFLPPLITLFKLYQINKFNTINLKDDILKFAKQINQEKQVKQILKNYE